MMDMGINMAPTVGIVALCAALGLSRATFYRQRRAAAAAVVAPLASLVIVNTEAAQPSGRSPVAVFGLGTEGATASPLEPALAAGVGATRNGAAEPLHVELVATASMPSATASTTEPAIADEVDETRGDAVAPLLVETTAVVAASTPATPAKKPPPRKLPDDERAAILAVLNEDRFCNFALLPSGPRSSTRASISARSERCTESSTRTVSCVNVATNAATQPTWHPS
jgi:hypothetical protein